MVGMAWLVEWSVGWHGIFNEEILLVHFFTELCVVFLLCSPIHSLTLFENGVVYQTMANHKRECLWSTVERGEFFHQVHV